MRVLSSARLPSISRPEAAPSVPEDIHEMIGYRLGLYDAITLFEYGFTLDALKDFEQYPKAQHNAMAEGIR